MHTYISHGFVSKHCDESSKFHMIFKIEVLKLKKGKAKIIKYITGYDSHRKMVKKT